MEPRLLLDYFKSIADRQGKYHDHKETTAWACLVLHLALCGALLHLDIQTAQDPHRMQFAVLVVAAIATVLSCLYIRKQLQLKDVAGAQAGIATYFMSEMATSPSGTIVKPLAPVIRSGDTEMQWEYVMPSDFVALAKQLNDKGRGAQFATRVYMYGLLLTASFTVLASVACSQNVG